MTECMYCPSKLINHTNLYRHLLRVHKYRCFRCKVYFKDESKYRKHKDNNHKDLEGGISKRRKIIRKDSNGMDIIAPVSYKKKGAVWCYTCSRWSRGCSRVEHTTSFIPFIR